MQRTIAAKLKTQRERIQKVVRSIEALVAGIEQDRLRDANNNKI